jgi:PAS domain S-box-containing protein
MGTGEKRVVVSHTNITERKRAEEALRESQTRLDLAIRSAHLGVWSWDIHEGRRYFDRHVCHLLGLDSATFTGSAEEFFRAVHPEDHEAIKAALSRVMTEDTLYETEYRSVWPDGSIHDLRTRGKLHRDETGTPRVIYGIVWDVTEHRKTEQERERLEAHLHRAQKLEAIGTLAGGIAHDFNNILGAILGYTEMARDSIPEDSIPHQDLEQVLKAAHRARDLVRQILSFSRQGEDQARKTVEIAPIVKEALKLLRSTLPSTIELHQNIAAYPLMVSGDSTQLHQIVVNLCTNAAHAMREKGGVLDVNLGEVQLDAAAVSNYKDLQPGSYVRLTVSDTGHGMDADTLERIFDPYFTTKEVGEGSGLGLAVVHGIVRRHEGGIYVQSEPGQGTTFEILFPMTERSQRLQTDTDSQPIRGGGERVLFVDDEEPLATLGERMLHRLGYRVTMKMSSLEAIELFRKDPGSFDLVITDYTMPKRTGIDLAREFLEIRPGIPIILCTGYSEMVSEETVKAAGVRAFLMKPLGLGTLAQTIRKVFDEKNS